MYLKILFQRVKGICPLTLLPMPLPLLWYVKFVEPQWRRLIRGIRVQQEIIDTHCLNACLVTPRFRVLTHNQQLAEGVAHQAQGTLLLQHLLFIRHLPCRLNIDTVATLVANEIHLQGDSLLLSLGIPDAMIDITHILHIAKIGCNGLVGYVLHIAHRPECIGDVQDIDRCADPLHHHQADAGERVSSAETTSPSGATLLLSLSVRSPSNAPIGLCMWLYLLSYSSDFCHLWQFFGGKDM